MVKSCNNPIQVRYKTEIEEILGRSHYYSGINKYRRWDDGAIKLLFLFLIDRKDAVRLLSTNRGDIKLKLWSEASDMLLSSGHHYSPQECMIKWKNIKKNYKDDMDKSRNNPIQVRYKTEVEKILVRK
uniref:Myb/SANT-like DNA-binding domain-containing protein n=2 Tax=Rhizophagus irregularis TaxID=588596 RepID=U9UP64_RHIID